MKPYVSKSPSPSVSEPLIAKPTRGELWARLEMITKKKRSVKRKTMTSPKGCPPAQGKILKVGASSSPSSAAGATDSSLGGGGGDEPPLEVLHIYVWSLTSWGAAPSPTMTNEVRRDHFGAVGSEDSLLSHAELAARVVSSILRDSDLKKVDALSVEEALALLLQGIALVRPNTFVDHFLYCFSFVTERPFLILWQVATYTKGLARRANLTKGSTKTAKSYKAKVASLIFERADLQAQIRDLAEELVKHKSNLKHALTVRARAEDREKRLGRT